MTEILLIIFAITLIYMAIANRLSTYINILMVQGTLLFGVTFIELNQINIGNLMFILSETIIVKAIAIPYFMKYIIKKNKITREAEPFVSNFFSVVIITCIIFGSFLLSKSINDPNLNKIYFVIAISALFSGLYFIISRRKIITHVIGFVIIENGVFILALAVGNEMPIMVNIGILLDIFVSVIILGIFANKIGDVFKDQDIGSLNQLKD